MYSWKRTRTLCAVLLLVPVVHLAYNASRDILSAMNPSPHAWDKEIEHYTQQDSTMQLPTSPLVVVGGQRVKLWHGLEALMPRPVLMRGLGKATVDDIIFNYQALIGFYRPGGVVFLPDNSEFHLRDMKSATELVAGIRKLVELDRRQDPSRYIYVFVPIKTPLFPADDEKIDQVSGMLRDWASTQHRIAVLDANVLLRAIAGRANPDFYLSDGINLNESGYLRLSMLLLNAVQQDGLAAGQ